MRGVSDDSLSFLLILGLFLWLLHAAAWLLVRQARLMVLRSAHRISSSRLWARTHPYRAALQARFPRLATFLERRLEPRNFSGLPLTLLLVALCYTALLIGDVIEALHEAEEFLAMDRRVDRWLAPHRKAPLLGMFNWLTELGANYTLSGVSLVATGFFWAYRRRFLILPLWISILGAQTTTWLGKFAFARARPEFVTGVTALSFSFPSAHATGAVAVYGFIAFAIIRDLPGLRERFEIAYWTLALTLLIGFSRIFLSVHYLSDVATGFLVGIFWLLAGVAIAERRCAAASPHGPDP